MGFLNNAVSLLTRFRVGGAMHILWRFVSCKHWRITSWYLPVGANELWEMLKRIFKACAFRERQHFQAVKVLHMARFFRKT